MLPNTIYEVSIALITKPKIPHENCKPISLINIDANNFNKMLTNQVRKEAKGIYTPCLNGIYPRNSNITNMFFYIKELISVVCHIDRIRNKIT